MASAIAARAFGEKCRNCARGKSSLVDPKKFLASQRFCPCIPWGFNSGGEPLFVAGFDFAIGRGGCKVEVCMCGSTDRVGWGFQKPIFGEAERSKTSLENSSIVLSFTMISIMGSHFASWFSRSRCFRQISTMSLKYLPA